jgi:hypothetical protein
MSTLNFFLTNKDKYEKIINNINDIINNYKIKNQIDLDNKIKLCELLSKAENNKRICEINILRLCKHIYIEDYIDITPETSKKITYCKKCQLTFL